MKLPRPAPRIGLAIGALGLLTGVVLASGGSPSATTVSLAGADDAAGSTSTTFGTTGVTTDVSVPTTTDVSVPAPGSPGDTRTIDATGAGAVAYAVSGDVLTVVRATPAAGWTVGVEQSTGREVEVDFRSGTRRVQVNVEVEDGEVRERVRTRDDADDTDVRTEATVPSPGSTTSTTIDDSNDDSGGDRSGSGSRGGDDSDDDDDRSGSGSGGGDDDRGDDHSGPGGGDD